MNRHGLSAATLRELDDVWTDAQRMRVRVELLNLDRQHITHLSTPGNQRLLDGQINWNNDRDAEVTRTAQLLFNDPRKALPFDSDAPSDAAFWYDRIVRVITGWRLSSGWVELVPFTGPVVDLSRDGRVVSVVCDGMERLALANCWAPLALGKGMKKTDAIKRILSERANETRFDFPDLPHTLPDDITLHPDDKPWEVARDIAASMDRQLYYDGHGDRAILRKHPDQVAFEFRAGRHVLTDPKLQAPQDWANCARVVGGKPKGSKRPVHAQAVAKGPLNPGRLAATGSGGVSFGRHIMATGQTIRDDKIKTHAHAQARADRELADALKQPVEVTFDSIPGPGVLLDPGDVCRVKVDDGAERFRWDQASMPLNAAQTQGMSVGYLFPRLVTHNPRPRKRKHGHRKSRRRQ